MAWGKELHVENTESLSSKGKNGNRFINAIKCHFLPFITPLSDIQEQPGCQELPAALYFKLQGELQGQSAGALEFGLFSQGNRTNYAWHINRVT